MSGKRRDRIALAVSQWPPDWQHLWLANTSRFTSEAVLSLARPAVGRWLALMGPAAIDAASFGMFLTRLRQATQVERAPLTAADGLFYAATVLWPDRDWRWLRAEVRTLRAELSSKHKSDPPYTTQHGAARKGGHQAVPQRKCLPVDAWPTAMREAWLGLKAGQTSRPCLRAIARRDHSPLAGLSQAYVTRLERGMGRYLLFAQSNSLPNRPTENSVKAWLTHEHQICAPKSVASYCFEVWRVASLIWPGEDWGWLSDIANRLDASARPVRSKTMPSAGQLRDLGWSMMYDALDRPPLLSTARLYLNGLLIAFLTEKPMRLRNLAGLRWADVQLLEDGASLITLATTKNRRSDVGLLSPDITQALMHYRSAMMPLLGGKASDALWPGEHGAPMTAKHLSRLIGDITEKALGIRVSPHRFRYAAAQTIAHHAPGRVRVASRLLGHADTRSITAYEDIARSAGAAAHLSDILADYDMPPVPLAKSRNHAQPAS